MISLTVLCVGGIKGRIFLWGVRGDDLPYCAVCGGD